MKADTYDNSDHKTFLDVFVPQLALSAQCFADSAVLCPLPLMSSPACGHGLLSTPVVCPSGYTALYAKSNVPS